MFEEHAFKTDRVPDRPEREHARTQSSDRPGGDLEDVDLTCRRHPALSVDRPVLESQRRCGTLDVLRHAALQRIVHARWRHVNRLLEERSVKRIRLVEDREHAERAASHHTFHRELTPVDVLLDEDLIFQTAARGADLRAREQCTNAFDGCPQLALIIRAYNAATAG